MTNRLAGESSPYLRQHRENPVDWHPWGSEAFELAEREDRPVLLSVGYSACHWCHVMAHESFEDPETARLMNENFVNVKVDREERPDVDAIYMNAVQAMTGSGGWPMTVVLTPQGEPFFGGTYFPADDRYGRPSFRRVLSALAGAWRDRRDEVLSSAGEMRTYLNGLGRAGEGAGGLDPNLPRDALEELHRRFDDRYGGFGAAPKFPPHSVLRFLLARPGEHARELAHVTLRRMANGGIFDQIGGGFARYSVDEQWLVPHFEKMLYDNAQLLSRYSEAYRHNADPLYQQVIEATVAWLARELRHPAGGFYSALDADSEGEEGRFYVWDEAEFDAVLGPEAAAAKEWFSVTTEGNFEGRNILTAPDLPIQEVGSVDGSGADSRDDFATRFQIEPDRLDERVEGWKQRLLAAREERERPGLDDKVLTSWNGLAIGGLADAGRVLHRPEYVEHAREAARFVRGELWRDGRLLHAYGGGQARIAGLLEDYAYLGLGLLALYHATFEEEWLLWALELCEVIATHFADDRGAFFSTPDDGEPLIVRPKGVADSAVPSENAAAAELFVQVARLTGRHEPEERALSAVAGLADLVRRHPTGLGATLSVMEFLLHPPREVAVIGDRKEAATQALLRIVQQQPLPYAVVAHADGPEHPLVERLPFLEGRGPIAGRPAAYVCEAGVCRLPVTEPDDLARELVEQAA
ncbi:MAG: thioredoxin domain-containing protein [Trueperaceae bacterium]